MNSSARIPANKRPTIIFDLDGTLYYFKEGSFRKSGLQKRVLENAKRYVVAELKVTLEQSEQIIADIINRYGENISIALEREFGFDRYEYFNRVWDIPAREFIRENKALEDELAELSRDYDFILLSDAPRIWINHVLSELKIEPYFTDRIFSGEGDARKTFNNAYESLVTRFNLDPSLTWSVGDQETTDILPAKAYGFNTVLVGEGDTAADYQIDDILGLKRLLQSLSVNNSRTILEKYLTGRNLPANGIKEMSGSSSAGVFIVDDKVYKVEDTERALNNHSAYLNFSEILGDDFINYFPSIQAPENIGPTSVWSMSYVPGTVWEKMILSGDDGLSETNCKILKLIADLAEATASHAAASQLKLFLDELLKVSRINLSRAGLAGDDFNTLAGLIKKNPARLLASAKASLIHRDLTVGNIIVDAESIRLIDPRSTIPYGEKVFSPWGNVAWDLAGYFISLERKQAERLAAGQTEINELISATKELADSLQQAGWFNQLLWDLCCLTWYSVYSACNCDYCLAPERRWLYDEMVDKLKISTLQLIEELNAS